MRLVRAIDTKPQEDENCEEPWEDGTGRPPRGIWYWYLRPRSADDAGSKSVRKLQDLEPHLQATQRHAERLVTSLGLKESEAAAVRFAAKWHDSGKRRVVWQRSIGNRDYPARVLAKSETLLRPIELNKYRHELGSLLDVLDAKIAPDFAALKEEAQDLALHLIAAHHGRARPHFPLEEAHDPERPCSRCVEVAAEVPRRFARLQRKYGRWGLAYLESLVRAADKLASGDGGQ
jgi:CRISPR-associated endonuclease/helicase Cas3